MDDTTKTDRVWPLNEQDLGGTLIRSCYRNAANIVLSHISSYTGYDRSLFNIAKEIDPDVKWPLSLPLDEPKAPYEMRNDLKYPAPGPAIRINDLDPGSDKDWVENLKEGIANGQMYAGQQCDEFFGAPYQSKGKQPFHAPVLAEFGDKCPIEPPPGSHGTPPWETSPNGTLITEIVKPINFSNEPTIKPSREHIHDEFPPAGRAFVMPVATPAQAKAYDSELDFAKIAAEGGPVQESIKEIIATLNRFGWLGASDWKYTDGDFFTANWIGELRLSLDKASGVVEGIKNYIKKAEPMTLERAVAVLNERKYTGRDNWHKSETASLIGHYENGVMTYGVSHFEAIAIAEKLERGK